MNLQRDPARHYHDRTWDSDAGPKELPDPTKEHWYINFILLVIGVLLVPVLIWHKLFGPKEPVSKYRVDFKAERENYEREAREWGYKRR
jgi:hypothetical protein